MTHIDLDRHPILLQVNKRCWHFSNVSAAVITGWWECGGNLAPFDLVVAGRALSWEEKRAAWLRAMETEVAPV